MGWPIALTVAAGVMSFMQSQSAAAAQKNAASYAQLQAKNESDQRKLEVAQLQNQAIEQEVARKRAARAVRAGNVVSAGTDTESSGSFLALREFNDSTLSEDLDALQFNLKIATNRGLMGARNSILVGQQQASAHRAKARSIRLGSYASLLQTGASAASMME